MDNWELYYRTHAKGVDKELTGSPPLSFVSNGRNLVDYRIYGSSGGVGDRTANIMPSASEQTITSHGITVTCDGKGKYYVSGTNDSNNWVYFFFDLKESFTIPLAVSRGGQGTFSFWNSKASVNGIRFLNGSTTIDAWQLSTVNRRENSYSAMGGKICNRIAINIYAGYSGNLVLSPDFTDNGEYSSIFEPYGYKIPVMCGGTTTIYLDEPLDEGESISMSDTGISIPTINGSNTLSIGTTVQPSNMYIKYSNGGNINQSLMTYLEHKYNVAKE